jgi:hydroxymethylpyrimidine pyrophosphatase-like HAD family hydrolase
MIGDDEADLPARVAVDRFYAVGNASPKIKKVADFSAKLPYTRGVVEILNFIDKMDDSR